MRLDKRAISTIGGAELSMGWENRQHDHDGLNLRSHRVIPEGPTPTDYPRCSQSNP